MLTLLAVLALPMQTAAHTGVISNPRLDADRNLASQATEHGGWGNNEPSTPFSEMIQWIRVYKNPEIVHRDELQPSGGTFFGRDTFMFPELGLAGFIGQLYPSFFAPDYNFAEDTKLFWVRFKPTNDADDPGGLIDTGENSGRVTATENTSVGIGDMVAIAIRVKGLGVEARPDIAIGPIETKTYGSINVRRGSGFTPPGVPPGFQNSTVVRPERKWRLSPNLPMQNTRSPFSRVAFPTDYEHTLVYQFEVTTEHADFLNTDGPWLKHDFDPYVPAGGRRPTLWSEDAVERDQRLVPPGNLQKYTVEVFGSGVASQNGVTETTIPVGFEWPHGAPVVGSGYGYKGYPDPSVRPSPTSVKPFNTSVFTNTQLIDWGGYGGLRGGVLYADWAGHDVGSTDDRGIGNDKVDIRTYSHYHLPRYDPALPDKEDIFYPKIELPDSRASTTMDVPSGTQTGAFTVTLHFVDGGLFEGHDLSPTGLKSFETALTAAFADSAWTVKSLAVEDDKRPTIASQGDNPTEFSSSTEYQLVLEPPLGVKDTFALQIPENIVMDAGENGNEASASVTVSVDTELRVAEGKAVEIAAPAAGAYLADDVIEVRVPFAQDGLTYAGDDPPYITIYLGAGTENPRHATWQQGEESAGSTVVPFRYTIDAADPIAESVRVGDEGLLIPTGTTLMNGAGLSRVGSDPMPKASGESPDPSPPKPMAERLQILTPAGAPLPTSQTEKSVTVLPTPPVYLPPDDSAPKAGMSSVPRSPIVFNELGNGSGDTNDWLELRNVTGDAVSLKDWELSIVQDGKKEDTSLVVFTTDVSVPAEGLLLLTNSDPTADGNLLSGGDDIATAKAEVKGSSHLYLVNAGLSLPDDGKFLLILRKAKEKLGLNEAFVDVAGGGGSGTDAFVREQEGDYDTYVWPLQVLEAPGSATEDALSSGKVWLRAKADIVGYHRDAWAEAAFTGVGYDRKVSKSAETAGTPGYPNGAVKTEPATPRGAVTISEVMLDSAGGTLPQWIELYNASKTDALNINRWELEIQNVDSEELVGRPIVRLTLQEKVIQPNQTLLIVTGNARASSADVYPEDRVYNLLELHDKNLRIKKPSDTFLSATGFYLRLTDRNEHLVDEVGNTDGNRRTDDTPAWALPVPLSELEGMRSSLVRRYDNGVARDGKEKSSWALAANFAKFKAAELHYGHADDIGTPGYRQGGALPVELSSFTVTRVESGSVIVTWTTESEVDNAGFNLRRSLTRDGGFTLLNPALIAGAGTTGERQTYTFIDTSAKPGVEHYYQIEEVSFGGKAETLVTRRLRGPVSPAHRALKTLGEVKQRDE